MRGGETMNVSNDINAAIVSGQLGLNKASDGITQASLNIAQKTAQLKTPQEVLADAAQQQLGSFKQLLPQGGDTLTNDLVSLSVNSINAQANAKVLGVANDVVGRIIDELA